MGRDKAGVVFGGRTLLSRVAETLAEVADRVLVVARADQAVDAPSGTELVRDAIAGAGPLAGLDAALRASGSDLLIVVAVDMPLVRRDVLELLIDAARADPAADAVMLVSDHGVEPLHAVYRSSATSVIASRLGRGAFRLLDLIDDLDVVLIPPERWRALDPDGVSTTNVNTPEDLQRIDRR